MIVWFTGGPEGLEEAFAIAEDAPIPAEVRTGAVHTKAELTVAHSQANNDLSREDGAAVNGSYSDPRRGVAVIEVVAGSEFANDPDGLAAGLSAVYGVPFEVEIVDEEGGDDTNAYGGGWLYRIVGGGAYAIDCTAGFTMQESGGSQRVGLVTAGHCNDGHVYWSGWISPAEPTLNTSLVEERRTPIADWQFFLTGGTEVGEFYCGSCTGTVRNTDGYFERQYQLGLTGCHYGRTTGYSCGEIVEDDYQPDWTNACPGAECLPYWMRASGGSLNCDDFDSGGPWFWSNHALGIHKGSPGSSCVFMAMDFVVIYDYDIY